MEWSKDFSVCWFFWVGMKGRKEYLLDAPERLIYSTNNTGGIIRLIHYVRPNYCDKTETIMEVAGIEVDCGGETFVIHLVKIRRILNKILGIILHRKYGEQNRRRFLKPTVKFQKLPKIPATSKNSRNFPKFSSNS